MRLLYEQFCLYLWLEDWPIARLTNWEVLKSADFGFLYLSCSGPNQDIYNISNKSYTFTARETIDKHWVKPNTPLKMLLHNFLSFYFVFIFFHSMDISISHHHFCWMRGNEKLPRGIYDASYFFILFPHIFPLSLLSSVFSHLTNMDKKGRII